MIRNCPVCGMEIITPDYKIRSHETYAICLTALDVELARITQGIRRVMRLEMEKRAELEQERQEV